MTVPIMNAVIALNRTAAAERSFIFPINGLFSKEIRSQMFSMAELKISETKTKPIEKMSKTHSKTLIFNKNPKTIAKNVKKR